MKFALLLSLAAAAFAQHRDPAIIDDLVTANHILASEGILDGYGHVSVRNPANPNHYFLARSLAPGLVTPADIIEYDLDGNAMGDTRLSYRERFIHGEIYKMRPDVMAIVHDHSPAVIPFSVSSVPLRAVSHMAAFIGEGIPVYEIRDVDGMTDMLVSDQKRGQALAKVLGNHPAALMRGHGAAVVGATVKEAVGRAVYLDLNARVQEQAILLGGKVTYFEPEEARKTAPQDGFERAWGVWKQKASAK
ncbi:MAG TPA: class II aldolase/adducin family protein [Bryobacteraceae bacterium]|jgi:ribulose-5-phosphate 4-epimerase/fuculose-1-phosphate aldolase|nr:class II aldolase/adducin family protein [Bryobacteraceae bacterium]